MGIIFEEVLVWERVFKIGLSFHLFSQARVMNILKTLGGPVTDGDLCLSHQPASAELQKPMGLLCVAAWEKGGGKSVLGRTRHMSSGLRGIMWVRDRRISAFYSPEAAWGRLSRTKKGPEWNGLNFHS